MWAYLIAASLVLVIAWRTPYRYHALLLLGMWGAVNLAGANIPGTPPADWLVIDLIAVAIALRLHNGQILAALLSMQAYTNIVWLSIGGDLRPHHDICNGIYLLCLIWAVRSSWPYLDWPRWPRYG